ncbi:hypothetical protein FF011L_54890 [Roseimaritima multifibrata]|uniref:Uncharacterized protein n=1 Tax=Roseimaritima multifibrata TaxID=1930274 RepID=A0A517MPG7_9BACT|nr:hypothetical protein [Roseimaritima multifibrata]QDS96677.1 hypothetical protein FF011L_54890 [Roseimaritima multifibrata]
MLCRRGITHLAISNYYPSAPCKPTERISQFREQQDFATIAGKGYVQQKMSWNDIIRAPDTGWFDKLPTALQEKMPFETGDLCFPQPISDAIFCPNAEHHSMTDSNGHFNAVGSEFASGTFDVRGKYMLHNHGYAMGTGLPWREAFSRMIDALQIESGGGITINHPKWSGFSAEKIQEYLDFDPRVLGIEIWNSTAESLNGKGWSLDEWDAVLATGRRCFGFSVSDHAHNSDPGFKGRNVLLIDGAITASELPAACLQAYRNGDFYSSLDGNLKLNRCQFSGDRLTVEVSGPSRLRVVSATGIVHEQTGTTLDWTLPTGPDSSRRHVYLRVEAEEIEGGDRLFTQAFHLN